MATDKQDLLDRLRLIETRIRALQHMLLEKQSVEEVLKAAGKKTTARIVPVRMDARNDLSDEHTVLSLICNNVPGLLYHVARAVATLGLDIHTAKVTTLGLKQVGDQVNLESDLIGKYVERLLQERGSLPPKSAPVIDQDYLKRRGLI